MTSTIEATEAAAAPHEAAPLEATPLKAGALIDASAVRDPARLDVGAVQAAVAEHGVVLLKGLDLGRQEFVDLTERFPVRFMEYVGGANNDRGSAFKGSTTVLTVTGGAVFGQAIPLHGEMFYTQPRPGTLFFCCITPAAEKGETTICDGVKLWAALPQEVRDAFEARKVVYRRIYKDDSWTKTYKTDSLDALRETCRRTGVQLIENDDGSLETVHVDWAWRDTPAGRAFINSVLVWAAREHIAKIDDSKVRWEDGSAFDPAMLYKVHAVAESLTLDVPWEPGMLAIVDNLRVMHGRRAYEDRGRDIIMRMGIDSLSEPAARAAE